MSISVLETDELPHPRFTVWNSWYLGVGILAVLVGLVIYGDTRQPGYFMTFLPMLLLFGFVAVFLGVSKRGLIRRRALRVQAWAALAVKHPLLREEIPLDEDGVKALMADCREKVPRNMEFFGETAEMKPDRIIEGLYLTVELKARADALQEAMWHASARAHVAHWLNFKMAETAMQDAMATDRIQVPLENYLRFLKVADSWRADKRETPVLHPLPS